MQGGPDTHILVVEDDTDTREALCETFIDAGYLPFSVGDGVEALEHLRTGARPSLIVLDLMLPRIDGWRFLSILAENADLSTIPVVVTTGALDEAHPPGVPRDHVMQKPIDTDQLMGFVTRYCGISEIWSAQGGKSAKKPPQRKRRKRESSSDSE